ncbi:MAG: hypothetical protein HYT28_02030 [Parcubacteria group bacterium]|nr:hypothetical protein [Parcubacteria group bacterium]
MLEPDEIIAVITKAISSGGKDFYVTDPKSGEDKKFANGSITFAAAYWNGGLKKPRPGDEVVLGILRRTPKGLRSESARPSTVADLRIKQQQQIGGVR